jgi:outer membrane protein OmpA-like peptidoglycan-associated protein
MQELLVKINDFLFNNLKPLEILVSKEVVLNLSAEISFQTGKFVLSQSARPIIAEQISKIEMDIKEWRNYLNHHNENIFSNDVFYIQVNVVGFADKQGTQKEAERKKFNQELSDKRAASVAIEFEKQIQKLTQSINVKLIYLIEDIGKGEELPPGVVDGPANDVNRRICIISAVSGPSSVFQKRK